MWVTQTDFCRLHCAFRYEFLKFSLTARLSFTCDINQVWADILARLRLYMQISKADDTGIRQTRTIRFLSFQVSLYTTVLSRVDLYQVSGFNINQDCNPLTRNLAGDDRIVFRLNIFKMFLRSASYKNPVLKLLSLWLIINHLTQQL